MARAAWVAFGMVMLVCAIGWSDRPEGAKEQAWVELRVVGGLGGSDERVTVGAGGSVHVDCKRGSQERCEYDTKLNAGEMAWLRMLVNSTEFSVKGEQGRPPIFDAPDVDVTVTEKGKERRTKLAENDSASLLVRGLERLANQGLALADLKRGSTYTIDGALNPLLAAPKALQPAACAGALEEYVRTQDANLNWAVEALAYATTPEEFAGTIAQGAEARADKRRQGYFSTVFGHPTVANIPKGHLEAMMPLARAELARLEKESPDEAASLRQHLEIAENQLKGK